MPKLLSLLENRPAWVVLTAGLALTAVISLIDVTTGAELSFFVFYFAPVALVSWYAKTRAGLLMAVVCTATWEASFLLSGGHYSTTAMLWWNTSIRGLSFLVIAYLVGALGVEYVKVRDLSQTDFLTGLMNKRAFLESAEMERLRCGRHERGLSIAYLDVDKFKEVNDRQGHDAGDRLLIQITRTMRHVLRRTDLIARVGGDEFVLLLPEADFTATERVLNKVKDAVGRETGEHGWPVTLSVGGAVFPVAPDSLAYMVQCADELMYAVKKGGRNNIKLQLVDASAEKAQAGNSPQRAPTA